MIQRGKIHNLLVKELISEGFLHFHIFDCRLSSELQFLPLNLSTRINLARSQVEPLQLLCKEGLVLRVFDAGGGDARKREILSRKCASHETGK